MPDRIIRLLLTEVVGELDKYVELLKGEIVKDEVVGVYPLKISIIVPPDGI